MVDALGWAHRASRLTSKIDLIRRVCRVWHSPLPLMGIVAASLTMFFGCEDVSLDKPLTRVADSAHSSGNMEPPAVDQVPTSPVADRATQHGILLTDFTDQSQINFVHDYDSQGSMYIAEPVASGLASFDFDLDGLIDVYFLNGGPIPANSGQPVPNALFRNLGDMQFMEVTQQTKTGDERYSLGVAVADFDGDGFPDLFVNNFGPNTLYRNNGDGTFSDATAEAGVQCGPELGAGACFLDIDGDGLLDLYIGNYVKRPIEANVKRTTDGFASYPGPLDFQPEYDFLFRNDGDGSFSDHSQAAGISLVATTSMGTIAGDFDEDGDSDLIVVNDVDRNLLYQNDGSGKFEEIGILSGIAFSHDAQRNGNMGVDSADYDNDGDFDLFTTTFSNDLPILYQNDGLGNFTDVTLSSGAGKGLLAHANWGTAFIDLENDGDKDLMIANGHTDPNVHHWAYTTDWKVANTLLLNIGNGRFENISTSCGNGLTPVESSRGLVADDFDNDGDVDVIILNALAGPTVIRNACESAGNWLHLDLHGSQACRDAVGARVFFEIEGKKFVDEVRSGRGYQSSFGQRLYFGLAGANSIPRLTIRWPDGTKQILRDVAANQLLTVIQAAP